MNSYYSFLVKREESKKEADIRYRDSIEKELRKGIIYTAEKFDTINKVIIFGSFVEGGFNRNSDVDIYMEGLRAQDYYEVKRILEDAVGTDVDLLNNGDRKDFIDKIKKRGVIIYEREAGTADSKPS